MTQRVLVIDGSLTVRMDIGEALESAGFASVPAASLGAARAARANGAYALIVLDATLPDGDGCDLLAEVKRETPTLPVILLSNEQNDRTALADDVLGKPYDVAQLVTRARALTHSTPIRRILVIDDSPTYRNQIKEALALYDVHEAASGEEGLAMVSTLRPDAIVVDGVLPGIDGATVIRRLKLDMTLRGTPCLLLTAAEGSDEELRALEAGADSYVRKSEDLGVIQVRLAALLRNTTSGDIEVVPSLLAPKRLLAIDDSRTYLAELGERLREEGYDVTLAGSGEEGLASLTRQSVDCILLDLVMPEMSGTETCRRIKQTPEWRDIPLVMLTAQEDRNAMIAGINAGADDYIAKSADFDVLKARLRAQLRRKHFEDENRGIRDKLVRRETELAHTRALEQANRDLASAKDQADKSNRFKSSFLANMSHELRTPLNAIIGFAELLYDGAVPPEAPQHKEFLGDILSSGRHLLQLINDVLDLSKVEAGKLEFRPEPVALEPFIAEVLATLRKTAADKLIRVKIDVDASLGLIEIDPGRLKQILFNYASNALKFTPREGAISVRARAEGPNTFRLEVEDTGIGISPEEIGRLFSEFEQLDAGAAKKHGGTGLGLALTKRLVEAQGGSVGVDSTLGRGSTFYAILPRDPTKA